MPSSSECKPFFLLNWDRSGKKGGRCPTTPRSFVNPGLLDASAANSFLIEDGANVAFLDPSLESALCYPSSTTNNYLAPLPDANAPLYWDGGVPTNSNANEQFALLDGDAFCQYDVDPVDRNLFNANFVDDGQGQADGTSNFAQPFNAAQVPTPWLNAPASGPQPFVPAPLAAAPGTQPAANVAGPPGRTARRSYQCDECNSPQLFRRAYELRRHKLKHKIIGDFPCPIQGCRRTILEAFKRKDKLKDHLQQRHRLTSEEAMAMITRPLSVVD